MRDDLKKEIAIKAVQLTDKLPKEKDNPIKPGVLDMGKKREIALAANNLEGKARLTENLLHNLKLPKNKASRRNKI